MARDKLPCLSRICQDVSVFLNDHEQYRPWIFQQMCMLPKLQELWGLIIANPQWTAAHIIAHYGVLDGLKDISIPS